jgi:HK97 family phage major capsid protein
MPESATEQVLKVLSNMESRLNKIETTDARLAAARDTGAQPVLGAPAGSAPYARRGENIMTSRGFYFGKMLGMVGGHIPPEFCKVEGMLSEKIRNATFQAGGGFQKFAGAGHCFAPLWPDGFNSEMMSNDDYYEMKSLLQHGVDRADPEEIQHWYKKAYDNKGLRDDLSGYGGKAAALPAQSWTDQAGGGTFVPPPTFGPPIELLRNREALLNAGATVVPLGPSGRITYPRLITPTASQGQLENNQTTPTTVTTGALNLNARKMITVVVLPNELLRYGAPATEALIRADIFKSVALQLDFYLLQGNGSQTQPLGLATMGSASGNPYGLALVTQTGASGSPNQLSPQDAYSFPMVVEENNGNPDQDNGGFIMRPQLSYAFSQTRWTPYSGAGQVGGFVYELVRDLKGKAIPHLAGYPVTKTVQVVNNRGGVTNATYVLFSGWADYLLGLFGAIEFVQTDVGYTLLSSDQCAVRCVLTGDGGPRHPGTVAFCDSISCATVGP